MHSPTLSTRTTAMDKRLAEMYPWVNQTETPLPICWNPKDKHQHIQLTLSDTKMLYKGPGKTQKDAAACRTKYPIPLSCGLFYFEVKVISKGKDGYIGVGLSLPEVNLNRLPGWDKGSYGYHGDDGHTFWSSGTGRAYGPTFSTGDVIGCGVDLVLNNCFYTKNGNDLGIAFTDLPTGLYPCVGLQSPGEVVETNFGQEPFVFDLATAKKLLEVNARDLISKYQPKLTRGEWEQTLQKIILDYLVHNGFHGAAESFSKSTGIEVKESMQSMSNRLTIQKLVLQGRVSEAIGMTQELYPGVLDKHPLLHFRLKVRQFIEMVGGSDKGVAGMSDEIIGGKTHLRSSRTPSPRDTNRNGSKHANANGVTKEDGSNGFASPAVMADTEMETEVVVEDQTADNVMDVDTPSSLVTDGDYHMNGAGANGDVPQSMDFDDDDEDEENKVIFGGNPLVLKRTLEFGKHLNEVSTQIRRDGRGDVHNLASEAFSLMAYSDPWRSPLKHLLDPLQREPVCASLNSALLGEERQTSHPALKVLISHSKRLFPLQAKKGSGVIAFRNIFEVLQSVSVGGTEVERAFSSSSRLATSDSDSSSC